MAGKLRLVSDPALALPSNAATRVIAFLGQREAGKTYAANKLAELMLDRRDQVVALDPVGVWYGLRLMPDGKTPSPYKIPIFGGQHGDVPLEPTGGKLIADLVVDRTLSCVIDLSLFTIGEQQRFALDFGLTLFHRKAQKRSPLWLPMEESHVFVPEQTRKDPGAARLLGAYERIAKIGRNFGIGLGIIDQRPQSTNKNVLNLADALFAMRVSGSQERKALRLWIVENLGPEERSLVDQLPSLKTGEAFLWSPAWMGELAKVHILERVTYNASSTPKGRMRNANPKPLTQEDMAAVTEAMKATIERAKAEDPKLLQQRIRELEKQIKQQTGFESVEKVKVKRVEIPIFTDAAYKGIIERVRVAKDLWHELGSLVSRASQVADQLNRTNTFLENLKRGVDSAVKGDDTYEVRPLRQSTRLRSVPVPSDAITREKEVMPSDGKLAPGPRRMLEVLARRGELSRRHLGALAAVKHTGGSFGTYLTTLKSQGLIIVAGDKVAITEAGVNQAGVPATRSPEEYVAQWKLPAGPQRMIEVLLQLYPQVISRTDLAARTGFEPSGGSFGTYLSKLRAAGLIEVDGQTVRASEELYQ